MHGNNHSIDGRIVGQFFSAMCDASDAILLAADAKGVCTFVGGGGLEKSGLPPDYFIGKSALDVSLFDQETARCVAEALAGQTASGIAKFKERYFEIRHVPVSDDNGIVTGTVGLAVDITEKHLEELAEHERGRIFDALFHDAQDAIFIIDRNFNVVKTNKAMDKLYPSHCPLQGKKCHTVYYTDRVCSDCPAEETFRTGRRTVAIDFRSTAPSKPGIWLEQTVLPMFDMSTGEVRFAVCCLRDVSVQKKAEEEIARYRNEIKRQTEDLRKSEAKLRMILESNTAAICFFDVDRRITYCNGAFEEFTGYSREELTTMHTTDLIDFEDERTKDYIALRDQVFTGSKDRIRALLKHRRKDGSSAWADICITAFQAVDPVESHYVAIMFDITDRHRLAEELQMIQGK